MKKPVAIIGGGLAGIAAAIRLAEADCRPIVIEARRRLGGRATSFIDPRTGRTIDNCQHVLLGCCTNLIDLYERLDVLDRIQWHRRLHWTKGRGVIDELRADFLPAPLHLARSLRRMRLFTGRQKRHILRAMWRMIRLGAKGRYQWRDRTFAEFLDACGQPESVVREFWDTVIVSACNLNVRRVAASCAMQVFQDGFLANRWSYTMGLATVPLGELYEPAAPVIEEAGGELRLGAAAQAIAFDGARVTGVVTSQGIVDAAAVVSAVPFDRLGKLVGETMKAADRRLAALGRLEFSPILAVHLYFDRPVMELPHLVVVGKGVQWLFNKGAGEDGGQHVHAVISAADEWIRLNEEEIIRRVLVDVQDVIPQAKGLVPPVARVVKERRATFAPTPHAERCRPPAGPGYVGVGGGGIKNLFLAGDWCDTGWPATMEGAVRSGYAASAALTGTGGVVEDVPPGPLARVLGLG